MARTTRTVRMGCSPPLTQFLSMGLRDESLTDIAADMWNHGIDMSRNNATFAPGEMKAIADYIWYERAIEGVGEVGRGAQVFVAKRCAVCHDDPSSGAPSLSTLTSAGRFSGSAMVSVLTSHGPAMLDRMRDKHIAWPHFTAEEMSSLIAYLNTRGGQVGR